MDAEWIYSVFSKLMKIYKIENPKYIMGPRPGQSDMDWARESAERDKKWKQEQLIQLQVLLDSKPQPPETGIPVSEDPPNV